MRLLNVIPSVSVVHGGPTQALLLLEKSLSAAGISVTTVTTDDDGPGRRFTMQARPTDVSGARRIYFRKWLDFYKAAPTILPWLWRHVHTFDVVHIHSLFSFTCVAAALLARWRGVPYVIRPLGTLSQYGVEQRRPWLKQVSLAVLEARILRYAAAVHFTSEIEQEEAIRLSLPLRGVVIPLAVRAEGKGDAQRMRQDHPILRGRKIVLFLSRLDPKKNVEGLLKAFAAIRVNQHNVALLIAGDGLPSYVDSLKKLAQSLGLDSHVAWLGQVDGAQKAAALAAAQVFVLPSFSENFGIAAAEAMRAGLACVLGQGVGIGESAQAVGACIVVSPEPIAIAHAVTELLVDEALRRSLGERAREFARGNFSVQAMVDELLALYSSVLAENRKDARNVFAAFL